MPEGTPRRSSTRLPEIEGVHSRRTRAAIDHLSFEDNFHASTAPTRWRFASDFIHLGGIHQKLSRTDGAAARDACGDHNRAIRVGIPVARHDCIILVSAFGLLRAIQEPNAT